MKTVFKVDPDRCGGKLCVVAQSSGRWIPVWLIGELAALADTQPVRAVQDAYHDLDSIEVQDVLRMHRRLKALGDMADQ